MTHVTVAPEIIELQGPRTSSDIWSVGCVIIEMIEGRPPYYSLSPISALYSIVHDEYPPIPNEIPDVITLVNIIVIVLFP